MKLNYWLRIAALPLIFWSGRAPAPVKNGSGGDDVRLIVTQSRDLAARRVRSLKPCAFRGDANPEAKAWILAHQEELAHDLEVSPHSWIDGPQPEAVPNTCALTNLSAAAEIQFSFNACHSQLNSYTAAGSLLVHESVHHFGVASETLADNVAISVYGSSVVAECDDATLVPQIAVTPDTVCALLSGTVRCRNMGETKPALIEGLIHPRLVRGGKGSSQFCALDDEGVKCWNQHNTPVLQLPAMGWQDVVVDGWGKGCASSNEQVLCWGEPNHNNFSLENDPRLDRPRKLALGETFACAIQEGGVLCPSIDGVMAIAPEPKSDLPLDVAFEIQAYGFNVCVAAAGRAQCWDESTGKDPFHLATHPSSIRNVAYLDVAGPLCLGGDGMLICRLTNDVEQRYVVPNLRQIAVAAEQICVVAGTKILCTSSTQLTPLIDRTAEILGQ